MSKTRPVRPAGQAADNPRLAEALGSPGRDLALQAAAGEPAGRSQCHLAFDTEQRRHQDQYYLPACISAWLAFMDVDENNGTIFVQPGSHKNRLLTQADFQEGGEFEGWEYNDAVDEQAKRNALLEVPVQVSKGSVVFFDGVLVHRGGPILQEGSDRHVLANHYIPYGFDDWPHRSWTRHAFDGRVRRHPEPTD